MTVMVLKHVFLPLYWENVNNWSIYFLRSCTMQNFYIPMWVKMYFNFPPKNSPTCKTEPELRVLLQKVIENFAGSECDIQAVFRLFEQTACYHCRPKYHTPGLIAWFILRNLSKIVHVGSPHLSIFFTEAFKSSRALCVKVS